MSISDNVTLADVQAEIERVARESKGRLKYLRALARVLESEGSEDGSSSK